MWLIILNWILDCLERTSIHSLVARAKRRNGLAIDHYYRERLKALKVRRRRQRARLARHSGDGDGSADAKHSTSRPLIQAQTEKPTDRHLSKGIWRVATEA